MKVTDAFIIHFFSFLNSYATLFTSEIFSNRNLGRKKKVPAKLLSLIGGRPRKKLKNPFGELKKKSNFLTAGFLYIPEINFAHNLFFSDIKKTRGGLKGLYKFNYAELR